MFTPGSFFFSPQELETRQDDTQVEVTENYLNQKTIDLVCGGGIAAIEVPRLVRQLRRFGAQVRVFATENALKFVGLDSLRWASQQEVVVQSSGLSEHICLSDAVVVVPATANFIAKASHGICADSGSTLIQSAFGMKKTVIFCPTMHNSMAQSPIVKENISKIDSLSYVHFLQARQEEGKQKIPDIVTLARDISHVINREKVNQKKPLFVTLGASQVMLDSVRCVTNLSSGRLGFLVVKLFAAMGYQVSVLAGRTEEPWEPLLGVDYKSLLNYDEIFDYCKDINPQSFCGLIHLLAGSDYSSNEVVAGKIDSSQPTLSINMVKTNKILNATPVRDIPWKIGAKLTSDKTQHSLDKAESLMLDNSLNGVFWSCAQDAWTKDEQHHAGIFLEKKSGSVVRSQVQGKQAAARLFFEAYCKNEKS